MESAVETFVLPTHTEIVEVLQDHALVRLRKRVLRAYLVGSFAKGCANDASDVDILLEVRPAKGQSAQELEDYYRRKLLDYFVKHDIRGKRDDIHPNWCGRRVDVYFTYDADSESRPKVLLV